MCRRLYLLVYYLLALSGRLPLGRPFSVRIPCENARQRISSAGRCSIHNGRLHQLSRIDRSNGRHLQAALPLNAGCCLCRPQDSLSHGGARPACGCINLHPRPAYLPRAQTLVPISINYRKLWHTHFLRVLCILTPPLPSPPASPHPDQRPMSFSRNSQFHRRGRYRLHPQTTRKWHQKGRKWLRKMGESPLS